MTEELKDYVEGIRKSLQRALEKEDYEKAFIIIGFLNEDELKDMSKEERKEAESIAFYQLAELFDQANDNAVQKAKLFGISCDKQQAIKYYSQAARLGNMDALPQLNVLYYITGQLDKSAYILEYGVKIKQPDMCYAQGMKYYKKGKYEEAIEMFKIAYEQDPTLGGYELGKIYENGTGVEKDLEAAFYYYLDAADCGDKLAMKEVGLKYKDSGIKTLASGDLESARWYLEHAIESGLKGRQLKEATEALEDVIDSLKDEKARKMN